MKVYWGELHCHCGVSYGQGTPVRLLNVAREHLDFCTVTGHAFWPDMPMGSTRFSNLVAVHLGGFAKLQLLWKDLQNELRQTNVPGQFVTIPSYEWHSMEYGDYNCYFKENNPPLIDAPDPTSLAKKLGQRRRDFMIVPHHIGYVQGFRGLNWGAFDESASPLVEIYSNHGCGEADDAPYEYHFNMGPRVGESMVRTGLLRGHRFGFCAGTDNHHAYPGHYGHGRTGVFAKNLDRKSIWQSLKQRRTIASTGARIIADMSLDSSGIGQVTNRQDNMNLRIDIQGTAPIDKVELIEGCGRKWRVSRLPLNSLQNDFIPGRYKVKIECGWGRPDDPAIKWHIKTRIKRGKLLGCDPCFRYSRCDSTDEKSCDKTLELNSTKAEWLCRTVANPSGMTGGTHFNPGGTQAMILDIEAHRSTTLEVVANTIKFSLPVAELVEHSAGQHLGGFCSGAIKIHRAIAEREFNYNYEDSYQPLGKQKGFVYLRISQCDGQIAWGSPIWFE